MNTHELCDAAASFHTPFYIYDTDLLSQRVREIRTHMDPAIRLCYAMKANPFITYKMAQLADRIEVCSPGELRICIRQQVPAEKILLSGVNKHPEDIREALSYGVRHFTAESLKQMTLLSQAASSEHLSLQVYPRLGAGSQFGMSKEDIAHILQNREAYPGCAITGLHYFTGTQRKAGYRQKKDVEKILAVLKRFAQAYRFTPEEIEYGPGLYVPYFKDEAPDDLSGIAEISTYLEELTKRYQVTVEMGRYFVASCGYYLTSIDDSKQCEDTNYLIVDGGIHQLNYYGGNMGIREPMLRHLEPVSKPVSTEAGGHYAPKAAAPDAAADWCVCGSLCTTADVLLRTVRLSAPEPGDVLVFENTGAYSVTESSALFLSRDLPQVLLKENDRLRVARPAMDSSLLITK